jgi:hypothetical protein
VTQKICHYKNENPESESVTEDLEYQVIIASRVPGSEVTIRTLCSALDRTDMEEHVDENEVQNLLGLHVLQISQIFRDVAQNGKSSAVPV